VGNLICELGDRLRVTMKGKGRSFMAGVFAPITFIDVLATLGSVRVSVERVLIIGLLIRHVQRPLFPPIAAQDQ